jgi:hypothetical protein
MFPLNKRPTSMDGAFSALLDAGSTAEKGEPMLHNMILQVFAGRYWWSRSPGIGDIGVGL